MKNKSKSKSGCSITVLIMASVIVSLLTSPSWGNKVEEITPKAEQPTEQLAPLVVLGIEVVKSALVFLTVKVSVDWLIDEVKLTYGISDIHLPWNSTDTPEMVAQRILKKYDNKLPIEAYMPQTQEEYWDGMEKF